MNYYIQKAIDFINGNKDKRKRITIEINDEFIKNHVDKNGNINIKVDFKNKDK